MHKIKLELVTNSNTNDFDTLYDKSHVEEALWYLNEGWYSPRDTKHAWNDERYIIYGCNINGVKQKPIGYFVISKTHHHLRASINGLYIIPEYRKLRIPEHVILFVGNKVFGDLGYNSITVSAWSSNKRIIKLYDSVLARTGHEKEYFYYGRKFHDKISWGVTYKESIWAGRRHLTMQQLQEALRLLRKQ